MREVRHCGAVQRDQPPYKIGYLTRTSKKVWMGPKK
jgi:hypothetical protein